MKKPVKRLRSLFGLTTVNEVERWLYDHIIELDRRTEAMQSGRVDPPVKNTPENRSAHSWMTFDQATYLRHLTREIGNA